MQAQDSGMDTVQLAPEASYCSCGSPQKPGRGCKIGFILRNMNEWHVVEF